MILREGRGRRKDDSHFYAYLSRRKRNSRGKKSVRASREDKKHGVPKEIKPIVVPKRREGRGGKEEIR